MKQHWFMVIANKGSIQASSYFAKEGKNISKSEIDNRFKSHFSEQISCHPNDILISNISYLGYMTRDEFLN